MDMKYLVDKEISLRHSERKDASFLYRCENTMDIATSNTLFEPLSLSYAEELVRHASSDLLSRGSLLLIIEIQEEDDKKPIGFVQLYNYDFFHQRVAIGIALLPPFQGKEYGSRVLSLMVDYTLTYLPLKKLYAEIVASNNRAIKCFEKQNFSRASTLPQWYRNQDFYEDLHIYTITR